MNERGKTAIILAGSGARSAHGGGFLYALAKEIGITKPDIMIGSSGDSGNVFYFSAGQYEEMRRIFEELISTWRFISPLRFWRVMDVDYLVDTVFRKQAPLDVAKVLSSPIRWFIPITDFDTGIPRYVSADDRLDLFEILRATEAAPIFFGKKIPIFGKRYIDGELGPTVEDHVKKALEQGAERLLVINHTGSWSTFQKILTETYALATPRSMREAIVRDIHSDATHITLPDKKMIIVSPQNLPIRTIANNREKLKATFARGMQDALALKDELRTLFA